MAERDRLDWILNSEAAAQDASSASSIGGETDSNRASREVL